MRKKSGLFEMAFTAAEDAVKIAQMTINDVEYYINLVEKPVAGCDGLNFERSSTVGKMLSNSLACDKAIVCERVS